jgi:hypothetical protein
MSSRRASTSSSDGPPRDGAAEYGAGDAPLGGRFVLQDLAGQGGMGTVYRARDLETGEIVAVKLLRERDARAAERFSRESKVLSELRHPHIVRHVAHGMNSAVEPWLAMEWLEGESLGSRLSRGALSLSESLSLSRRVAEALAAAHARGVIHRDVKPSNLFLVGGRVEDVKVLDFGIARLLFTLQTFTRTGGFLGTPGYMAPEQARGEGERIDPRADVFSLGAVLFECLTGQPAFEGSSVVALLAKLLLEEAPRLRARRQDVPEALDALVGRMLSKNPAARPADGAAALREIEAIESALPTWRRDPSAAVPMVEPRDPRLWAIVVLGQGDEASAPGFEPSLLAEMRAVAVVLGARLEELSAGMALVALTWSGSPTDLAARAARCALRLRALPTQARMALVIGYSEAQGALPVGPIVERAFHLIETGGETAVRIDAVTRALLDARFEVEVLPDGPVLQSEREIDEEARVLLGKPTPFVGRDRELRHLLSLFEATFDDDCGAQAVVVIGPPGIGKTRLRQEIIRHLRAERPGLGIAIGRGDASREGSAFSLLASAIRSAAGMINGEPRSAGMDKLVELCGRRLPAPEQLRVAEILGEIVGTPFPDDTRPKLRTLRKTSAGMAEQIADAIVEVLRASSQDSPFMLVLEDLQWGDAASIKLVDRALRELSDHPFLVVGLSRPELLERFPSLWRSRGAQQYRLGPLPRRAAEAIVQSALGAIDAGQVGRILDRAEGNAFYLEELVRAVAEGRGDSLPETVLGMVQARLEALPFDARRFLRAASVYGDTFWRGSVLSLLPEAERAHAEGVVLPRLLEREVLMHHAGSRFAGEEQYAFRHALLREGAYAMLPERERAAFHEQAAEWLLAAGEHDARVLAAHFDRGAHPRRAVPHYLRAAEGALLGMDFETASALAARGIALGAEGPEAAALHAVRLEASFWTAEQPRSVALAEEARLRADEALRGVAAGSIATVAFLCRLNLALALIDEGALEEATALADAIAAEADAAGSSIMSLRARLAAATAHLRRGAPGRAEQMLVAVWDTAPAALDALWVRSVLAEIHLRQGRAVEALALAEEGIRQEEALRVGHSFVHDPLRRTRAEARIAAGW